MPILEKKITTTFDSIGLAARRKAAQEGRLSEGESGSRTLTGKSSFHTFSYFSTRQSPISLPTLPPRSKPETQSTSGKLWRLTLRRRDLARSHLGTGQGSLFADLDVVKGDCP